MSKASTEKTAKGKEKIAVKNNKTAAVATAAAVATNGESSKKRPLTPEEQEQQDAKNKIYRARAYVHEATDTFLSRLASRGSGAFVLIWDMSEDAKNIEGEPGNVTVVSSIPQLPALVQQFPAPVKDLTMLMAASLDPSTIPNNTLRAINRNMTSELAISGLTPEAFAGRVGFGLCSTPKTKGKADKIAVLHTSTVARCSVRATALMRDSVRLPDRNMAEGPGVLAQEPLQNPYIKNNVSPLILELSENLIERSKSTRERMRDMYVAKRDGTFVKKGAKTDDQKASDDTDTEDSATSNSNGTAGKHRAIKIASRRAIKKAAKEARAAEAEARDAKKKAKAAQVNAKKYAHIATTTATAAPVTAAPVAAVPAVASSEEDELVNGLSAALSRPLAAKKIKPAAAAIGAGKKRVEQK